MSSDVDFKYRKLYEQMCKVDADKTLLSTVFAVSYVYPGAITTTTARCRISLVYEDDEDMSIYIAGGTIEKWSDKGWQTVEEFFDQAIIFDSVEEALGYLIQMFRAFIIGMPVNVDGARAPLPDAPSQPDREPKLRVLSFTDRYKDESTPNKKDSKSKPTKDDDSFDWI